MTHFLGELRESVTTADTGERMVRIIEKGRAESALSHVRACDGDQTLSRSSLQITSRLCFRV